MSDHSVNQHKVESFKAKFKKDQPTGPAGAGSVGAPTGAVPTITPGPASPPPAPPQQPAQPYSPPLNQRGPVGAQPAPTQPAPTQQPVGAQAGVVAATAAPTTGKNKSTMYVVFAAILVIAVVVAVGATYLVTRDRGESGAQVVAQDPQGQDAQGQDVQGEDAQGQDAQDQDVQGGAPDGAGGQQDGAGGSGDSEAIQAPGNEPGNGAGEDPAQSLQTAVDADKYVVDSEVIGLWVPQLSSKQVGMTAEGKTWYEKDIYEEYLDIKNEFPNALILKSNDYPSFREAGFYVTIVNEPSNDPETALSWCRSNNLDADHCYAKKISNSGDYEGSTRLQH